MDFRHNIALRTKTNMYWEIKLWTSPKIQPKHNKNTSFWNTYFKTFRHPTSYTLLHHINKNDTAFSWLCWPPAPPCCRQHCRLIMCRYVGWVSDVRIQDPNNSIDCETRCLVYLVVHLLQLVVHHLYISHLHLLEVQRLNDQKTYQLFAAAVSRDFYIFKGN